MKLDIKLPMIYHANTSEADTFPHQILAAGEHFGVKFYVCSINGTHPTAYLRIPKGMPLYGIDYAEADKFIEVHYGFTYSQGSLYGVENDDKSWFLGWDYGHCGDFAGYYLRETTDLTIIINGLPKKLFRSVRPPVKSLQNTGKPLTSRSRNDN